MAGEIGERRVQHGRARQGNDALPREFLMNKFRRLGSIECNGGLKVNSSLLSVVLHD